jgi:hypothetical protein
MKVFVGFDPRNMVLEVIDINRSEDEILEEIKNKTNPKK